MKYENARTYVAGVAEVEVNPLLVTPDGALGLDARIVLRQKGDQDAR